MTKFLDAHLRAMLSAQTTQFQGDAGRVWLLMMSGARPVDGMLSASPTRTK